MVRSFAALGLMVALGACAGPGGLENAQTLADVEVAEETGSASALSDPMAPEGIGGRPLASAEDAPDSPLLSFFRNQARSAEAPEDQPGDRVFASLPADARSPEPPAPAGGLFGGLFGGAAPAPAARSEVGPNEDVAFGSLARLCGVDAARLGEMIERHQRYRLYDSAPGSTGLRNWYITGFDDGCARQFTAALALFGSVETHEQLRYGPATRDLPVTETDLAYKDVKSRVCGVRRDAPCGRRIGRMDRTSVFVTIYERFGASPRWVNAFLHDGEVAAVDIASN